MDEKETLMKQLLELRYVTLKTGALHPLQMKNLEMWGYLAFPFKTNEITAYFHWEKRQVSYVLKRNVVQKTKKTKKALEESVNWLNACVQQLLGDEYRVVVETPLGSMFKGKRKAKLPAVGKLSQ